VSETAEPLDDDAITAIVRRLSRPQASGARVIERASIVAEGAHSTRILEWIAERGWVPEALPPADAGASSGLYDRRPSRIAGSGARAPRRYVLPPGSAS
jgi:hypothetical protein